MGFNRMTGNSEINVLSLQELHFVLADAQALVCLLFIPLTQGLRAGGRWRVAPEGPTYQKIPPRAGVFADPTGEARFFRRGE